MSCDHPSPILHCATSAALVAEQSLPGPSNLLPTERSSTSFTTASCPSLKFWSELALTPTRATAVVSLQYWRFPFSNFHRFSFRPLLFENGRQQGTWIYTWLGWLGTLVAPLHTGGGVVCSVNAPSKEAALRCTVDRPSFWSCKAPCHVMAYGTVRQG